MVAGNARAGPGVCLLILLASPLPVPAEEVPDEQLPPPDLLTLAQRQSAPPGPTLNTGTDQRSPITLSVTLPTTPTSSTTAPTPGFSPGQKPLPDRWWFMREVQGTWLGAFLDDNRLSVSGWTEASYTASTDRVSNLPVVFNDRANTFLLQQQWFRLDRALVTSGTSEPTFGYHLDVLFGSDYRWTLIRGLWNSQLDNSTGAQNLYGVDPIQFYANAYVPGLFRGTEFRVGRTYNPWGYESLEAVSTPLLSRSYAFFNTPFTLMGVGAYTTYTSEWSSVLILANGNDTYVVPYEEARFFGKLTYASANKHDNVQLGCTLGRGRFNAGAPFDPATVGLAQEPAGHNNFNALDLVYTHVFDPHFTYACETMYGWQTAVPANVNGGIVRSDSNSPGTAHWASICQYLRFTFTSCVGSILRVETFDDFNGQRTGFPGLYTTVTGGIQLQLRKGVILRPELRNDYNGESRPFEGKHDLFTAASDLIVRW
jgi:hypothetical protein